MKYILAFIFMALLITACGSTKEAVVEEQPPLVEEKAPPIPQTSGRQFKKPRIDPEQLAAQLGLNAAQEKAFLEMWYKTSDDMMNIRHVHEGDRKAMLAGMKAVRDERNAFLKSILSDEQMEKYWEIMDENRKKMGGPPTRRGG